MKIRTNGTDLFFDVQGAKLVAEGPWTRERPTVVLLPTGPGIDHSLYKEHVGPLLAEVAQVVYLDLRGTGRSDWGTAEDWTLETWVADLAGFCDALELDRPLLLGTGIGGVVGLLYAAERPDRVERLVLVSTVARYVYSRVVAEFDRVGGPEAGEVAARYFADPTEATFSEYLRVCVPLYTREPMPADVVARIGMNTSLASNWDRAGGRDYDVRAEAAGVRCPTLVLTGEDDPASARAGVEELLAALPSELVTFRSWPATGHGVFRDRPDALEIVRDFLVAPEPA